MGLHHIALGAQDIKALATFYQDIFGLTVITTNYTAINTHYEDAIVRSIWLRCDDWILMIERITHHDQRPIHTEGVSPGPFLLVFDAPDHETFEQKLASYNIGIDMRTSYTVYARDIEGNRIAVSTYPIPE